jgi:hypothetical protein
MQVNDYMLEVLMRDRLAEMRAQAERSNQVRAAKLPSRPFRAVLADALIRLGRRLGGVPVSSLPTIDRGGVTTPTRSSQGAVRR